MHIDWTFWGAWSCSRALGLGPGRARLGGKGLQRQELARLYGMAPMASKLSESRKAETYSRANSDLELLERQFGAVPTRSDWQKPINGHFIYI